MVFPRLSPGQTPYLQSRTFCVRESWFAPFCRFFSFIGSGFLGLLLGPQDLKTHPSRYRRFHHPTILPLSARPPVLLSGPGLRLPGPRDSVRPLSDSRAGAPASVEKDVLGYHFYRLFLWVLRLAVRVGQPVVPRRSPVLCGSPRLTSGRVLAVAVVAAASAVEVGL